MSNEITPIQLIEKYKFNHSIVAQAIDMPLGTFNNKFSSTHKSQFMQDEIAKIKAFFIQLKKDIENNIEII